MTRLRSASLLIAALLGAPPAFAQDSTGAKTERAPTGKLRVALAV